MSVLVGSLGQSYFLPSIMMVPLLCTAYVENICSNSSIVSLGIPGLLGVCIHRIERHQLVPSQIVARRVAVKACTVEHWPCWKTSCSG